MTSSGTRSANASNSMRCSFVTGLAEDEAFGSYSDSGVPGTGAFIAAGVGFDSTTTFSGRTGFQNNPNNACPIFGDFTTVAPGVSLLPSSGVFVQQQHRHLLWR